jgi:Zn-dependent M28 family amino/carboxypeptidase
MAHTDSDPPAPGALDNASGVGLLVGLAPLVAAGDGCETWLVATGAEERLYTGRPDHLGASALVRRLQREGRTRDVAYGLSLDEVGAGSRFDLYSRAARPRTGVERAVLTAARRAGVTVRTRRDAGTGNSDHRELALAGMPAMKLGVVDHACRHRACDRGGQLRVGAFRRVASVVAELLGVPEERP